MVFNNSILLGAGGQGGAVAPFDTTLIGNSIWLDGSGTSGDAATDTWGSESNQDRWIWATWYQPLREIDATGDRNTIFASGSSSNGFYLRHNSTSSTFNIFCRDNAGNEGAINTSESYRDLTAWYHVLVDFDSANAVANDRISLYVNGVRVGTYSGTDIGQNNHLNTNVSGQTARIAQDASTTPNYHMKGYLAQTVFLDNKSIANGDLAITDFLDTYTFGTNGSQRIPKSNTDIIALASAAGNNSFCLDYSDSSNIVDDASTKGNDFTPTGGGSPTITSANQSDHTPSLVYPVVNALRPAISGKTFSEGNLKVSSTSAFGNGNVLTTFPLSTGGKWYWEVIDAAASANQTYGIAKADAEASANGLGNDAKSWAFYNNQYRHSGNVGAVPDSPTNTGTRYMFAVDVDAGKFWMGNDGTWWKPVGGSTAGDPAAGTNPAFTDTDIAEGDTFPAIDLWSSDSATFVFDEDDFAHTIPTGFNYLNSSNLTAPDYQGIDYFDATLYEGNGTGQRVGDFVPFTDAYTVDNSAMFEHDDARYLSRTIETPSSPNGRKGTWSVWFKTANIDTDCVFFDTGTTATNRFSLQMDASGQIVFSHGGTTVLKTSGDFKGDGAWHNLVLKVDTELDPGETGATPNRAIMFIDGVQLTSTDFDTTPTNTNIPEDEEIGYMDPGATQFVGSYNGSSDNQWDGYLAEVVFLDNQYLNASSFGQLDTSTNRWVPKSVSGLTFGDSGFYLEFETAPNLGTLIAQGTGTPIGNMTSGGGLAAAFDGDIENYAAGAYSNATSGNLGKDWGSGVTKTITGVVVKMLGNVTIDGGVATETMTLTVERSANGTDFTTVYTESGISVAAGAIVTRRDGFTNTAAARYARVSVSHGGGAETHISELEFYEGGSAGIGTDSSGNGNNFTQGGSWAASDQFTDTPSQNFAIMDFYHPDSSTATTFSEGNLKVSMGTAAGDGARGTLAYNGKMYWEVELDAISTNSGSDIGIATRNHNLALTSNNSSNTNAFLGVSSFDSNLKGFFANAAVDTSYGGLGNNFGTAGKYLMFAVDTDAGKFWAGYDGTWFGSGNPAAGTNDSGQDISLYDTWFPAISRIGSAGSGAFIFNFGQTSFAHTPPTGFSKLNQDNLDDTASKLTAWAWIKNRDATDNHILVDRVRGVGKVLNSNNNSAEATNANTVQRFFQRGVQVGSDAEVNTANESFVLWQWLLGDSATTGSSITTGSPSLTTTGIVADADHFSIISYTGSGSNATVAHGLSAAPEMYWVRDRTDGNDWNVYADGADASPASGSLRLDSGAGFNSDGTLWNGVPTASLINLGTSAETNELNKAFIAYCFRSVLGVCKIGTYTGNGDGTGSDTVDGPYVNCGFRPRWILFKWVTGGSLSGEGWVVKDTARQTFNPNDDADLIPSGTNAEAAGATHGADILSDGFKLRGGGGAVNKSGATYLYMAMADIGGNGTLPPIYGR